MHCIEHNKFETHGRVVHVLDETSDFLPLYHNRPQSIDSWHALKALIRADKARGMEFNGHISRWYTMRYPISKELLEHLWRYYT